MCRRAAACLPTSKAGASRWLKPCSTCSALCLPCITRLFVRLFTSLVHTVQRAQGLTRPASLALLSCRLCGEHLPRNDPPRQVGRLTFCGSLLLFWHPKPAAAFCLPRPAAELRRRKTAVRRSTAQRGRLPGLLPAVPSALRRRVPAKSHRQGQRKGRETLRALPPRSSAKSPHMMMGALLKAYFRWVRVLRCRV